MRRKLKQNKGETLIETLFSLLIALLSMALLTSAVLAATNINHKLREADESFRSQLEEVECKEVEAESGKIEISFYDPDGVLVEELEPVDVAVYESSDGTFYFYEYEKKGETP